MSTVTYAFRWRVLLIDGQVAELTSTRIQATAVDFRFFDPEGMTFRIAAELVLMVERLDRNHQPFPVSDRDLVALYDRTHPARPSVDAAPFTLVRKLEGT